MPNQFLILPLQRDLVAELFQSTADMPPEVRELLENLGSSGILMTVLIGFIAMLLAGMISRLWEVCSVPLFFVRVS